MKLTFQGRPVPWARVARGRGGQTYTPAKQNLHRAKLAEALWVAARGKTFAGAVRVDVVFDYDLELTDIEITDIGASLAYRTKRPDGDNLAKQVLEAIEKSGIVKDDAQVAILYAEKVG